MGIDRFLNVDGIDVGFAVFNLLCFVRSPVANGKMAIEQAEKFCAIRRYGGMCFYVYDQ